jgi:hypothetical protein
LGVDDVSDEIQVFGLVLVEELEQLSPFRKRVAEMAVGDEDGADLCSHGGRIGRTRLLGC